MNDPIKARGNIVLSFGASAWNALIGLAFLPIYLRTLGLEAYGVVGFFISYQMALSVLDLGLAPAVGRETARLHALGKVSRIRTLVATLGIVYWGAAAGIAVLTVALSPIFAFHWLQSRSIAPGALQQAVIFMGLATALRWPTNLYVGVMQGSARSGEANALLALFATLTGGASVLAILFISPTLPAFFIAQTAVALFQVVSVRAIAFRGVPAGEWSLDWALLRNIWKFAAGMTLLSLSGVIFLQLDKFILGRLLPLTELGVYVLASTIAATLYRLTLPVYQAFAPRLSALAVLGDGKEIERLHGRGTFALTTVLAGVALGLILAGQPLIALWTQNPQVAARAAPLLSIIVLGVVLDGALTFPAAIQLAHGATRVAVAANLWSLAIYIPITVYLTLTYGAFGGALAWLTLHGFHFLIAAYMMHHQLMPQYFQRWLLHDFCLPALTMVVAGLVGIVALRFLPIGAIWQVGTAAFVCLGGMVLATSLSGYSRREMLGLGA